MKTNVLKGWVKTAPYAHLTAEDVLSLLGGGCVLVGDGEGQILIKITKEEAEKLKKDFKKGIE